MFDTPVLTATLSLTCFGSLHIYISDYVGQLSILCAKGCRPLLIESFLRFTIWVGNQSSIGRLRCCTKSIISRFADNLWIARPDLYSKPNPTEVLSYSPLLWQHYIQRDIEKGKNSIFRDKQFAMTMAISKGTFLLYKGLEIVRSAMLCNNHHVSCLQLHGISVRTLTRPRFPRQAAYADSPKEDDSQGDEQEYLHVMNIFRLMTEEQHNEQSRKQRRCNCHDHKELCQKDRC